MNLSLAHWFQSFAGRAPWLDQLIIFCANELGWVEVVVLVLMAVFLFRRAQAREATVAATLSALAAWSASMAIKLLYVSNRPFVGRPAASTLLTYGGPDSFPSSHASFFFAIAFGLYFYHRRLGDLALLIAVLISLARVIAGLHWPLDIGGGVVLAALVAVGLHSLFPQWASRR